MALTSKQERPILGSSRDKHSRSSNFGNNRTITSVPVRMAFFWLAIKSASHEHAKQGPSMRPGQNNKQRMRSRNPGNNRKGPNPLTRSYESNGPDVKVRGTAHHVGEKYLQLARDAQTSGDPVMAESYLQHAEHYFRIIATAHLQQLQSQEGYVRPEGEALVDDADDDDLVGGLPDRFASPLERTPPPPSAYVPPQPVYAPQASPYQGRQQNYADRNTNDRNQYQDRQGQNRSNQQRNDQERGSQERSAAEWQERAAAERIAAERASAERPPQDVAPERAQSERAQDERVNQEPQIAERQPVRQDEERPRYDQRPQRQERFQPNRYAQERPNQNRDRDNRQDRVQQDRGQQDRVQQDRPQHDRPQQEPYRQDRNQQRDNRQPREFRPRMANGEREPRAYMPEAASEAPVLPSFITAPVRVIAPVEPLPEPVAMVAATAPAAQEAEPAAPVEKVRRRRVARPAFEEAAPLLRGPAETPDSGE